MDSSVGSCSNRSCSAHGRCQDFCSVGQREGRAKSIAGRACGNRAHVFGTWGRGWQLGGGPRAGDSCPSPLPSLVPPMVRQVSRRWCRCDCRWSGLLYDHGHLSRAVCCRLAHGEPDISAQLPSGFHINHPLLGRVTTYDPPRETQKTKEMSLNWALGDEYVELTDGTKGICLSTYVLLLRCKSLSEVRVLVDHTR